MKRITKKETFRPNQKKPGRNERISKGGNHPPKNKMTLNELIINIFAYSPKEKRAKPIAEYSTL
jgi:hypothetical protein